MIARYHASETWEGDRETPIVDIALKIESRWREVGLKLESHNPSGSIKYRTACGLVTALEASGQLGPGAHLVESTSGNLGVALAFLGQARGYRFTAVTDPKADPVMLQHIQSMGAVVVSVTEPDETGGYLLSRLAMVRRLLAEDRTSIWPNQYENPANPEIHYRETAPEICRQRPGIDAVFIAASTGGTLAGIGRYLRSAASSVKVVGVDIRGSHVFGHPSGKRLITGIGSSRPSLFLRPGDYDDVVIVDDQEAVMACHYLQDNLGIGLGGSAGAVVAACARYLKAHPEVAQPVCVCPDGRANYVNTLYNHSWLSERGLSSILNLESIAFSDASKW
ncbi:MAG TPA: pyridoxal-phosphate dependent enzyme [Trebonia sp.]|jgi:cysteine synthase A|nr:pyridoxal-phosphate dependent enzyme [Trebonia sp.]